MFDISPTIPRLRLEPKPITSSRDPISGGCALSSLSLTGSDPHRITRIDRIRREPWVQTRIWILRTHMIQRCGKIRIVIYIGMTLTPNIW